MDRTVDPCQDFYQFACGRFINKTIPGDSGITNPLYILQDQLISRLKKLLEGEAKSEEPEIFKGNQFLI